MTAPCLPQFDLRSKFGKHEFTWDGERTISEKPADVFDKFLGKADFTWSRALDAEDEEEAVGDFWLGGEQTANNVKKTNRLAKYDAIADKLRPLQQLLGGPKSGSTGAAPLHAIDELSEADRRKLREGQEEQLAAFDEVLDLTRL
jgi:hypothetical protein